MEFFFKPLPDDSFQNNYSCNWVLDPKVAFRPNMEKGMCAFSYWTSVKKFLRYPTRTSTTVKASFRKVASSYYGMFAGNPPPTTCPWTDSAASKWSLDGPEYKKKLRRTN
jgi:hypothetical protein